MIDASCDAKALLTEVIAIGCLSMSPSARCVYGCEKLRGWGGGGVLRFLGVMDKTVTVWFGVGFATEVSFDFIKYSNWCYTFLTEIFAVEL